METLRCDHHFKRGLTTKKPFTFMIWPRNKEHSCIKSCRLVKELGLTRETARLRKMAIFDLKPRPPSAELVS